MLQARKGKAVSENKREWTSMSVHVKCLKDFKKIMERHHKVIFMEPYISKNLTNIDEETLKELTESPPVTKCFTVHKFC